MAKIIVVCNSVPLVGDLGHAPPPQEKFIRPLQINSLFLIPPEPKTDVGRRLEMVVYSQV